jgi:hypothetical protein
MDDLCLMSELVWRITLLMVLAAANLLLRLSRTKNAYFLHAGAMGSKFL